MASKVLIVNDKNGGAPIQLEGDLNSAGVFVPAGLGVQAGAVAQSVDNRLVSDAQQAALVQLAGDLEDTLLAGGISVNMNVLNGTTSLFTVPTGKTCIITRVVVRSPSVSLTLASYSFGFTAAAYADVIANATHTGLDGATKAIIISPIAAGFVMGAAAAVFTCKVNTAQGAAATALVDVYGYLF